MKSFFQFVSIIITRFHLLWADYLEIYKSNLNLKKEGGDVFFFSPDVHTFLCVIIHYITKTNKNQLPIINIY